MIRVWFALMVVTAVLAVGPSVTRAKERPTSGEKKAPKVEDAFKRLDKNSDGKLSKEEFVTCFKDPEKGKSVFDKVDTNRDGYISLGEFKVWMKRMEKKRGEKE